MHASLLLGTLAAAALCGWSALLANQGIANFNDGVRPVVGEWTQGNLSRGELTRAAWELSRGFIVHESPFMAATALLLGWPLLLAADVIGFALPSASLAWLAGSFWGAFLSLVIQGLYHGLAALPLDVIAPLRLAFATALWALCAIPTVACGYQFGARAAAVAGTVSALVWLATQRLASPPAGAGAAVLAGLLILTIWSVLTDRHRPGEEEESYFTPRTWRLRRHLGWLMVQGALLGLAVRSLALSWNHLDLIAVASGHRYIAAALALVMVFSFWPASVTSATSTGVYQSVGLATSFVVAYLAPNPLLAALLCALAILTEISLLNRMNHTLTRFPTLRGAAESVRAAYALVVPLAVLAGAVVATLQILPDGLGVCLLVAAVVVNDRFRRLLTLTEAPLLAALSLGVIVNILLRLGYPT